MTTLDVLCIRLRSLNAERAAAGLHGLDRDESYMADLCGELAEVRSALIVAGVTEVASLRARLSGAQVG